MGRVADRLKLHRDQRLIYGPSRHAPGNNQFMYFHDNDGAISSSARIWHGFADYQPRKWPGVLGSINQWGPPPLRFTITGFPLIAPDAGRPTSAMRRVFAAYYLSQALIAGRLAWRAERWGWVAFFTGIALAMAVVAVFGIPT
jgi:hypothetical protein